MFRCSKDELIEVYDGLVPPEVLAGAYDLMRKIGFTTRERDFPEADPKLNMLSANLDMGIPVIHDLGRIISEMIKDNDQYTLDRVYANAYTPTDAPQPHQDTLSKEGLTIIYYANDEWDWRMGGETVFFKDQEVIYSVTPKAGRFVVFDSNLWHCARVQNTLGPKFRYTIVFKIRLNI